MQFNFPNIIQVFNELVFSEAAFYLAFSIIMLTTLSMAVIIFRFLIFLVSPYWRGSDAVHNSVFDGRRIGFRLLGMYSFLMSSLATAFLSISAIAIFVNALWMGVMGTPGLLKPTEILFAPRTDAALHLVLALIYSLLAGCGLLASYALWPLRADWIPWNDHFIAEPQTGAGMKHNAGRVFIIQTFAVTNVAAVFFGCLLFYQLILGIVEGAQNPEAALDPASNFRIKSMLVLAAITVGSGMAAFALWPLRRSQQIDELHLEQCDEDAR